MSSAARYIVVSPVKDEERHVGRTLESMRRQTLQPVLWIIVDDGSKDRTSSILDDFALRNPMVSVVRRPTDAPRQPGGAVIRAFTSGYELARPLPWEFIVKLDCDLSFDPDYFERLLEQFDRDPRLGIASGVYLEKQGDTWREVEMPSYHAAGACKVVRRECFDAIGGFIPSRGWDTVDEIRAMERGWTTRHFRDLKMQHWKPEGSGIGQLKTSRMHGEIYYLTGGGGLFFLAKVLRRMFTRPFLAGGVAMAWGFVSHAVTRSQRLVTDSEARLYRALLTQRLISQLRGGRPADHGL